MTSSRCCPAMLILSRRSAWRGVTPSRRIRWVMPMMAFIGVRISWDMLARKALLATLAASAFSALRRSRMSRRIST